MCFTEKLLKKVQEDHFICKVASQSNYLQRQTKFCLEHEKHPTYVETRWISLGNVLRWLEEKRAIVIDFLARKNTPWRPGNQFWVLLHILKEFLDPVELAFTKLQGRTTTLADQETEFKQLQDELADSILAIKMNFNTQTQGNEDDVQAGDWEVTRPNAVDLICNLNLWVRQAFETLNDYEADAVLTDVLELYIGCLKGIDEIFVQRNSNNKAAEESIPPFMPKELLALSPKDFNDIVHSQSERLRHFMTDQDIDKVQSDFRAFTTMKHRNKQGLEIMLAKQEKGLGFNEVWKTVRSSYPYLHVFIGGFATTFPNTATVEGDFSIISMEKNDSRYHLTNLSLQGIIQCKQFNKLRCLGVLD